MNSEVGKKFLYKPHRYKDRTDLKLSEFFFYPEITFHFHYCIYWMVSIIFEIVWQLNLLKMLGQYLCVLTARFFAGKCDLFLLFTWCDSHQTVVVIHISIGSTHGRKNFCTHLWADTFTYAINIVTMGIMVAFLQTARISYNTSKTSMLIWFRECASFDWIGGEENRARFSARLRIQLNLH